MSNNRKVRNTTNTDLFLAKFGNQKIAATGDVDDAQFDALYDLERSEMMADGA